MAIGTFIGEDVLFRNGYELRIRSVAGQFRTTYYVWTALQCGLEANLGPLRRP